MPSLASKSKGQNLSKVKDYKASTKRKPMKLIIGEPSSTPPFVKEQIIKLDPKVKGRGKGKIGVTIGGSRGGRRSGRSITTGMGGRRRK